MGIDVHVINLDDGNTGDIPPEVMIQITTIKGMVDLAVQLIDAKEPGKIPAAINELKKITRPLAIKAGIPESRVDEMLDDCENQCKGVLLKILADQHGVPVEVFHAALTIKHFMKDLKKTPEAEAPPPQNAGPVNRVRSHLN